MTDDAVRVALPGPVGPLSAWWYEADGPAPAVVLVHGYASKADDLRPVGPPLHATGRHVLVLDLRGHGESVGDGRRAGPPELAGDVHAAVDWLVARDDVTGVELLGHSMGGSIATIVAADRPDVDALVTVAAVADPTLTRIGFWPAWISKVLLRGVARKYDVDPTATFAVNRLAAVVAPALLLHGTRDRIVPARHLEAFRVADPSRTYVRLDGAGHRSIDRFIEELPRVVAFLDHTVASGRPPDDDQAGNRRGTDDDRLRA